MSLHRVGAVRCVLSISASMLLVTAGCKPQATVTQTRQNAAAPFATIEAPSGRPNLTSDLRIDAGKEFQYGGGDNGPFTLQVSSKASPAIRVIAQSAGGRNEIIRVDAGQTAVHRFENGDVAILLNTSATAEARADVRIRGKTDVEMKYEPAK